MSFSFYAFLPLMPPLTSTQPVAEVATGNERSITCSSRAYNQRSPCLLQPRVMGSVCSPRMVTQVTVGEVGSYAANSLHDQRSTSLYKLEPWSIHAALVLAQVTVGEEGFFVAGSPYTQYNPAGTPGNVAPGWAGHVGQVCENVAGCRLRPSLMRALCENRHKRPPQ